MAIDLQPLERSLVDAEAKAAEHAQARDAAKDADSFAAAAKLLADAEARAEFHRRALNNARTANETADREAKLARIQELAELLTSVEPQRRLRPAAEKLVGAIQAGLEAIGGLEQEVGALLELHREGLRLADALKPAGRADHDPSVCPSYFRNTTNWTPARYYEIAQRLTLALIVLRGVKPLESDSMPVALETWFTFGLVDFQGRRSLNDFGRTFDPSIPLNEQLEAAIDGKPPRVKHTAAPTAEHNGRAQRAERRVLPELADK